MSINGDTRVAPCRPRALAWLIVAAGCWGLDTTLSAYALRQLRPADVFVAETVVGSGIVWAYLRLSGKFQRPARLRPHLVLGLVEPGLAYLLFDLGLRRTSAISGGLLLSTETMLAVALAVVVLRERLSWPAAAALLSGTIGGALVSLGAGHGHQTLPGDLLVLAGSATAASYYVVGRNLPTGDDTLTGTAYQLLAALGVAVAYGAVSWPIQGSSVSTASAAHIAVAMATGIVGIAVPFFLINRSLGTISASTAALVLNLTPLFAVGSAIALLHEPLMVVTASGGTLILAGLVALGRFAPQPLEVKTS